MSTNEARWAWECDQFAAESPGQYLSRLRIEPSLSSDRFPAAIKIVMRKFYRNARGTPERLPWHRDSPSRALVAAVEASDGSIRALDVGCGAGMFSIWLAEGGAEVTGIDVFPEAIAMARSLADK